MIEIVCSMSCPQHWATNICIPNRWTVSVNYSNLPMIEHWHWESEKIGVVTCCTIVIMDDCHFPADSVVVVEVANVIC
jgi:hypothetical protein